MAPLWLPQNVQKRVFRYILTKLALFSNLGDDLDLHSGSSSTNGKPKGGNLADIDVSLGGLLSETQLALANVQLDTERLAAAVPGVFVRSGVADRVEVGLAVLGGVRVEGRGVRVTVSLKPGVLGGLGDLGKGSEEELVALLERTTADLAESILVLPPGASGAGVVVDEDLAASVAASMNLPPPAHHHEGNPLASSVASATTTASSSTSSDDEESASSSTFDTGLGLGYGMGDFSGLVNRVVDAAISQLTVSLTDLTLTVLLEMDVRVELKIGSVRLSTAEDGVRTVRVADVECVLTGPNPDFDNDEEGDESQQDEQEQDMDDMTVSSHPAMFKSTVQGFPAQSMYLDADNGMHSSSHSSSCLSDDDAAAFSNTHNTSNLMQSMLFSREEAASLYMSAMAATTSSSTQRGRVPTEIQSRIFWCESIVLSFKGLKMAGLGVQVGRVRLAMERVPEIVEPALAYFRDQMEKQQQQHKQTPATNKADKAASSTSTPTTTNHSSAAYDEDAFSLSKFFLQSLEINLTSSLLPNGLYEADSSIKLVLDQIEYLNNVAKSTQTLEVAGISLEGRHHGGDDKKQPIFGFARDGAASKDLTCQFSSTPASSKPGAAKVCKLMIPNSGSLHISTDDLFELEAIFKSYQPLIELLSSFSSSSSPTTTTTSALPKSASASTSTSTPASASDAPLLILGQTSVFNLFFKLDSTNNSDDTDTDTEDNHGKHAKSSKPCVIQTTVFPISFETGHIVRCPQVTSRFPDVFSSNANPTQPTLPALTMKNIALHYNAADDGPSSGPLKLKIMSANATVPLEYFQALAAKFNQLQSEWTDSNNHKSSLSTQRRAIASKNPANDINYQRAQHARRAQGSVPDTPTFEVLVSYLGAQIIFPGPLGKIEADLGDLRAVVKRSGKSALELSTIHVSRDMSDVDPALGHLSIVHNVNDRKLVSFFFFLSLWMGHV